MTQALRHFCRHCRGKLPAPTANLREAFDSPGCHRSFYRHRCLVCEREMPRLREDQKTCYRAECKAAWRKKLISSHFLGANSASGGGSTSPVNLSLKTSIKPGTFSRDKDTRAWSWRVRAAGAPITANQYHYAIVPDGPGCQWEGGEFERIEAKNRAALKAAGL